MNPALLFVAMLGMIVGVSVLLALPVMWLWNWLMPDLFGIKTVDFWQAFGLMLLSGMLFKSSSASGSKG